MDIIKEKIQQVPSLLNELDLDLWLVAVRETPVMCDPVIALVTGLEATWQSFFAYTRDGRAYALIGNFDRADYDRSGRFTEVRSYVAGVKEDLRALIKELNPQSIAINYSKDDPSSDGLTHGMYLLLCDYLAGLSYADRLVSAETLCSRLRARKTPTEIARLTKAAEMAEQAWQRARQRVKTGMTEIEIAAIIDAELKVAGATPSFETIVNAGSKTDPGHGHPTDARLEPGDLLHIDFGARLDGYCSDLQRLLYFRRKGEGEAPAELREAFDMVRDIITATSKAGLPGRKGFEIDQIARTMLVDNGYPEYQHALGHQLGRSVHDGGGLLGPQWERYGKTPSIAIDPGNVFTLELEIMLDGIGCVGLEEDVVMGEQGGSFLCPRQMELDIV
jgi:Xaa-Pro aminopeptidase